MSYEKTSLFDEFSTSSLSIHATLYDFLVINFVIAYLHTVNNVRGKNSHHLPYVLLHHHILKDMNFENGSRKSILNSYLGELTNNTSNDY